MDASSWKITICRPIFSDFLPYSPLLRNLSATCRIPTRGYEYSIPGSPPEADAKCLTLRSNLGPETSARPDWSEWLERQTNAASVVGSPLLCLSDTQL
jgi:hypothetical protein